jgi:hypothetical protein
MRGASSGRVVVLFDSRWSAPSPYHYAGKRPSFTLFVIFVHRNAQDPGWLLDNNLWLAYRHPE